MSFIDTVITAKVVRDVNNWWWCLNVEVTEMATEFLYEERLLNTGSIAYFGTNEAWVRAMVYDPNNKRGFGGDKLSLPMVDGSIAQIIGPWTGRPSVYMEAGFPAYMEVTVMNHHRLVCGMTRDAVDQILQHFDLPFHTAIGELWEGADEDCVILVPNP